MSRPIIEIFDCAENNLTKREMTAQEHAEYIARCEAEDAKQAEPNPKSLEERIQKIEQEIQTLKGN